ncbi:MAG: DUF86 domain-containing protein [bacterium]|nr:DUF86 domain-containing protein [bacterium]
MEENQQKIQALKDYFEKKSSVILAFLFGSRSKNLERQISDWDIAVYFKPKEYLEIEIQRDYPKEHKIWEDMEKILQAEVDFAVLNRVAPSLIYSVLTSGIPLTIKDRGLYLDLLCKTSYEAIDFWKFVGEFWEISQKAKSFLPEERARLRQYLRFLENEFSEIEQIKKITWEEYSQDSFKRKIIERWIENLVMVVLDIAKIVLASEKKNIPQTYRETLKVFTALYVNPRIADRFSQFAELRNIIVHEYLDIRWKRISNFIKEAGKLYPRFMKKVKEIVNAEEIN